MQLSFRIHLTTLSDFRGTEFNTSDTLAAWWIINSHNEYIMNCAKFRNRCYQVQLKGIVTRTVEVKNLVTKILQSVYRDKSEMKQNCNA